MASEDTSGPSSSPDVAAQEQAGRQPQWTWLARIRRPQGRKGEVFADILTDFPEKFADRRRLWLLPENPAPAPGLATKAADEARLSTKQNGLVSGHDFSHAEDASKQTRALAPEGRPAASSRPAAPREVELANHWLHKGGVVLHFSGVDSISDAETLAGLIVAIPQAERAPLAEDETYIGDLIGCTLADVAGAAPHVVGEIEDVDRTAGPVALLVVRGTAGEVLVPFAKSYLRKIDLEAKRVEMALPEGLTDLNVTEKT
jgi:16S rRNA processing protein RimM